MFTLQNTEVFTDVLTVLLVCKCLGLSAELKTWHGYSRISYDWKQFHFSNSDDPRGMFVLFL